MVLRLYVIFTFFFFFFWLHMACGTSHPVIEPMVPMLEPWSLNQWAIREDSIFTISMLYLLICSPHESQTPLNSRNFFYHMHHFTLKS